LARPGPQTYKKRQRELAKQEKRKLKAERRAQRKEQKALESAQDVDPGIDADIAEIVPGPQKPLF
jgi:hypothetical protein